MSRRATVVGVGLIGGSIGLALRELGWHVSGVDPDGERCSRGLELGALDAAGWDPAAEVTFVATPVGLVAGLVAEALDASPSGLVTDVGSVKASIVEAVDDPRFVGGHPMAGSELDGVEGADASMFRGANWVLTPGGATADSAFARVRSIVRSLGAEVVTLSPDRHDALVALVSHVPHLTAASLVGLAARRSEEHSAILRLAAGGFRDMTRVAAGQPGIWPDICAENRAAITEALDDLIGALGEVRREVAEADGVGCSTVSSPHGRRGGAFPRVRRRRPNCSRFGSRCSTARGRLLRSPPSPPISTSTSTTSRSHTLPRATGAWSS